MSGKKWLPIVDTRGQFWIYDIEKKQKYKRQKSATPVPERPKRRGQSLRGKALKLVQDNGMIRTRELEAIGIPRQYPTMMCKEGLLERVGHGIYRAAARKRGGPT